MKCFLRALVAGAFALCVVSSTAPLSAQVGESVPGVVALGDSLTFGVGSTAGNNYVDVLARWADIPLVNAGVSGDTTADALERLDTDVLARDPDVVIVFLGGNDILQGVPLDTTLQNLGTILDRLIAKDARVVLVGAHASVFDQTRDNRFATLAREKDVAYVPNALRGILGNPRLIADPVHPNDAGYKLLAQRIWPRLTEQLNALEPERKLRLTCEGSPEEVITGSAVEWRAFAWGGPEPGNYRYAWTGENVTGFGETVTARYLSAGVKSASVTATSGPSAITRTCRNSIVVTAPPLAGSCSVSVDSLRLADGDRNEVYATWRVDAAGGTGSYTFLWSGTDSLGGTDRTIRKTYVTTGIKEGTVRIESGEQELSLTCSVQVRGPMFFATTTSPLVGGCSVSSGSFFFENPVRWTANVRGGPFATSTTYLWDGDRPLRDSEDSSVSVTYGSPGERTGTVTATRGDENFEATCAILLVDEAVFGGPGGGGAPGCFIATAAYGTELAPQVESLRQFRDRVLAHSAVGRSFTSWYYRVSPPLADLLAENDTMRSAVRILLTPLVVFVDFIL